MAAQIIFDIFFGKCTQTQYMIDTDTDQIICSALGTIREAWLIREVPVPNATNVKTVLNEMHPGLMIDIRYL